MNKRVYTRNEDGTTTVTTVEWTIEDQIAEKEAQLLKMYDELQTLKNSQQN